MDALNIAAVTTDLQALRLAGEIQIAVASRILKAADQQRADVIRLLQTAVEGFEDALARVNQSLDASRLLDVFA